MGRLQEALEPVLRELKHLTLTGAGPAPDEWLSPEEDPRLRFDDRRNASSYAALINRGQLVWLRHLAGPHGYFEATSASDGSYHACTRPDCPERGEHAAHDERGKPVSGGELYIRFITPEHPNFDGTRQR